MRALYAIDLDQEGVENDVETARSLLERLGAVVDLLYVDDEVEPVAVPESMDELRHLLESARLRHEADLQSRLDAVLDEFPEDQQGTTHIADGDASADTIMRDMPGHDLVLVGTHGRQGVARAVRGSVAESVVRASRVPVLVVRGTIPSTDDPRVLAAVDVFDSDARALVANAAEWAGRLGAKLDLVHVVGAPVSDRNSLASHRIWADALDGLVTLVGRRLAELARDVPADIMGSCRMESGDPSAAIADLSKRYALVIVRTHGRHGVGRLLFGSVSEHVVRYSAGPVLVLPAAPVKNAA